MIWSLTKTAMLSATAVLALSTAPAWAQGVGATCPPQQQSPNVTMHNHSRWPTDGNAYRWARSVSGPQGYMSGNDGVYTSTAAAYNAGGDSWNNGENRNNSENQGYNYQNSDTSRNVGYGNQSGSDGYASNGNGNGQFNSGWKGDRSESSYQQHGNDQHPGQYGINDNAGSRYTRNPYSTGRNRYGNGQYGYNRYNRGENGSVSAQPRFERVSMRSARVLEG